MIYFCIYDEVALWGSNHAPYEQAHQVFKRKGRTLRLVRSRTNQVPPISDGHEYRRRQRARKRRKR